MDEKNRINRYDKGIAEERDELDDDYQTEAANEMTEADLDTINEDSGHDPDISSVYGWIAIALSVIAFFVRSEEHTSELQSRFDLVCRLLLEKKKLEKRTVRV